MIYVTDNTDYKIEYKTAITIGKFDGIHKGHQKLISKIKEKSPEMKTVLYTFDMNPASKVSEKPESLITTKEERLSVVKSFGIDYLYECPFVDEIRNLEASDFVRKIVNDLNVKYIAIGKDFKFGHNRLGDYKLLVELSAELGYEIDVIEKEMYNGREISSTYVREMISAGDMETVNKLLGYPYAIAGIVGTGRQLGRTIGIPTTNIIPIKAKLLPPNGVYVSKIKIGNSTHIGVTNIGVKPTVGDQNEKGAETFIFDFDQNVYGEYIVVELYYHVREEMKFDSIEHLKEQMEKDIAFTREYKFDR